MQRDCPRLRDRLRAADAVQHPLSVMDVGNRTRGKSAPAQLQEIGAGGVGVDHTGRDARQLY